MDPQQELFTVLKMGIIDLGYDEYDGPMPPEGTEYPFVYLADNQQTDGETKSGPTGTIRQTIHVWHNDPMKRGTVSVMLHAIKSMVRSLGATQHYNWFIQSCVQRILDDNTTDQPLMHGVLDIQIQFT